MYGKNTTIDNTIKYIVILYYKLKNTKLQKNAKFYNFTNCNYKNYNRGFVIFVICLFMFYSILHQSNHNSYIYQSPTINHVSKYPQVLFWE